MVSFYRCSFLAAVLVLVLFVAGLCEGKMDVQITNGLDAGTAIDLHCKSKDNDLGPHHLEFEETYDFSFQPTFSTLFFCRFWWGSESHWFNVYEDSRDANRCSGHCLWLVTTDGLCLFNQKAKVYDICQKWN